MVQVLLAYVEEDLYDPMRQGTAFPLLKVCGLMYSRKSLIGTPKQLSGQRGKARMPVRFKIPDLCVES